MNPSYAYEQIQADALDGRELEASVLLRAARKLNRCAKNWELRGSPQFAEELQDALAFNQRLWTFLQVEVSNPDHPLPAAVRKSVFQLSRYIDKTVLKLQSGGSLQELKSLIDLNNELAAGLASNSASGPNDISENLREKRR